MTTPDDLRPLLLELELDLDRKLLDASPLSGVTAERWAEASDALARAWAGEGQGEGVAEAAALVREAGAVWEALTPRVDALGPGSDQDDLMAQLRADPLGFDAGRIDALCETLELRGQAATRIAAAHRLLDEVEAAQRAGETAHSEARAKIAGTVGPAPKRALSDLEAQLHAVESLLAEEAFGEARDALALWTNDATRALAEAQAVAEANRAPLERRNQLRGLLKAYQAKARGVRALEREDVAALYDQAERALYTSPVDLDLAGDLVARYGRALNASEVAR
jgi:hypothetical protein